MTVNRVACQASADAKPRWILPRDSDYGDALRLILLRLISCSYLRNQQRRRFAKSALHHAGLEGRPQPENQEDTIQSPTQQTAEEQNEDSDAESS